MPIDARQPAAHPRLLEVSHVAHRLSVSQEFVRRLIRLAKLPAIRLGRRWRVDPRDLDAYIEKCRLAGRDRSGLGAGLRAISREA